MIAPSPPDEPPTVRRTSYGLFERPYTRLSLSIHMQSSDTFVTPSGIAPAFRKRVTVVASWVAMTSFRATSPELWGIPVSAKASLIVHGTP
jgi:hypothetical protein